MDRVVQSLPVILKPNASKTYSAPGNFKLNLS